MIFVAHAGPNSGYQLQTPSQESIVHLTTESCDLSWNACRRLSNCSHDNNRYPVSPSFGDHDLLMGHFALSRLKIEILPMRGNKMLVDRLAPLDYCDRTLYTHRGQGGGKRRP